MKKDTIILGDRVFYILIKYAIDCFPVMKKYKMHILGIFLIFIKFSIDLELIKN